MGEFRTVCVNARFLTQRLTGVQRFAVELSLRLKKADWKVFFLCPKNIENSECAQKLDVITFGYTTGHFWEQIELPLYLNRIGNPLLLNLCNTAPIYYSNKISTIHDLSYIHGKQWFNWKFRLVYSFLMPKVASSSLYIVTVSESIRKELSSSFQLDRARIYVVSNASSFKFKQVSKELKNGFNVISVGSMDPRKNLASLINAFIEFQSELEGIQLLIVGDEGQSFKKNELISSKIPDNIEFLGRVSDKKLSELYASSSLFVSLSLYEGFGIPNLEAMSFGLPVLVSKIESYMEVCGDAGYYVDPKNLYEIKEAILAIKGDLELRMKMQYLSKKQASEFSWNHSLAQLRDVIETAL